MNNYRNRHRVCTGDALMNGEETVDFQSEVEVWTAEPERPVQQAARAAPPIGQLLIEAGLIGESDLARALAFQARYSGRLGSILVRLGALSEEGLMPILANQLNLPLLGESDLPAEIRCYLEGIK